MSNVSIFGVISCKNNATIAITVYVTLCLKDVTYLPMTTGSNGIDWDGELGLGERVPWIQFRIVLKRKLFQMI